MIALKLSLNFKHRQSSRYEGEDIFVYTNFGEGTARRYGFSNIYSTDFNKIGFCEACWAFNKGKSSGK